ncbi:MAG TPA: DUF429 domain-containing protein [Nanoarchaeota archaeon]|nr:DUF429 domain-containing protein [Nanoarchaeota archaeon]
MEDKNNFCVVGIDLAGKEENPTGFCVLTPKGAKTKKLFTDKEILREISRLKPQVVAIDAPLWLPPPGIAWRIGELLLMKRGFRPLSLLLPSMRLLALRAKNLAQEIRKMGIEVIEVFAAASEKIFGLEKQKYRSKDEYDALLCALTAKAYLEGKYEDLGGIILPK